jgi:hypothetical protein
MSTITDIVAMKDITDFKDIRHPTGLSNTKVYSILFTRFNLSPGKAPSIKEKE